MSVFLSVHHLAAWAGVCPGSYESAGKQKSGRARKGNVHLRTILVGAAISAARTKGSYLRDKFHRLKRLTTPSNASVLFVPTTSIQKVLPFFSVTVAGSAIRFRD